MKVVQLSPGLYQLEMTEGERRLHFTIWPTCRLCRRKMYTTELDFAAVMTEYVEGPFGSLYPEGKAELRKDWAWRSAWTPDICRECDNEHDHRKSPSLWGKFNRWLTERRKA